MKKICRFEKNVNDQRGFSLVEVLVAVTLLAIGLLAVAQMQVVAITGNDSAADRTVAVALAEEMVDRIRNNFGDDDPGIYHQIDTTKDVTYIQTHFADPAEADALAWKARLEGSGLTDPKGTVEVTDGFPLPKTSTVTVDVEWEWQDAKKNITLTTIVETWGS